MVDEVYRPGLEGVIAGETTVSSVEQVGLWYRGYSIEDLAEQCTFGEVSHLLWYGELPTKGQLAELRQRWDGFRPLKPELVDVIRRIPKDVPMMDVCRTGISMAGHFAPSGDGEKGLREQAIFLTAQATGIIAARYRLLNGNDPIAPHGGLTHAAELLYQCHGKMPSDRAAKTLDLTLILYAEHEFNASTFVTRVCASTLSDICSCIVAGIGTLKGPLHGGANEKALELVLRYANAKEAEEGTLLSIKNKDKIMGFGHRVYKQGDHRAWILEKHMKALAAERGETTKVEIYDAIQNTMKREKNILPNVDYPCGLTYWLMDLPKDMYTPLFVAARIVGWSAHIIEQHENNRIIRPCSRYTGPDKRPLVPLDKR